MLYRLPGRTTRPTGAGLVDGNPELEQFCMICQHFKKELPKILTISNVLISNVLISNLLTELE